MEYSVNDRTLQYEAKGERHRGENIVLLNHALDLTKGTHWSKTGLIIEKLFDDSLFATFQRNTYRLLTSLWQKALLETPDNFQLHQYHLIAKTTEAHLAAVDMTKLIDVGLFPVPIQELEDRISEICRKKLIAKNPFDGQTVFHFRVIRPQQRDNNPLHRDVWLEDYSNCINLYIPVAGSNEKSSLVIVRGSHHWPESDIERTQSGAEINGVKFNVPAVTAISRNPQFIRPNPKDNEVLVFSPYLIHGGALNLNEDATRISIEVRLWKK
jgi:hypothetical protein